jgi:hypothetical protein
MVEEAQAKGMALVGPDGLLASLTKRVLELGLEIEMTEHLSYEKHDPVTAGTAQRIRYRTGEKRAWVDHRVRGFVLTGRKSQTTADSRAILAEHWATIQALVEAEPDGPWMRALTESGLRVIALA